MYNQQQTESLSTASYPAVWPSASEWTNAYNATYNTYYSDQAQFQQSTYYPASTVQYQHSLAVAQNESLNQLEDSTELSKSTNNSDASPVETTANIPAYFTTQKIVNNTAKLSYTVYQLELLNAIYIDMKYPNSVQKTLIAKLIGITRDQVKIWFQNRRRKDTLLSQGKLPTMKANKRRRSSDDSESNDYESGNQSSPENQKPVVEDNVIQGVLYQLKIHQNAPSRLSSKRSKIETDDKALKTTSTSRIVVTKAPAAAETLIGSKASSILTPVSSASSTSSSSSGSSSSEEETFNAEPAAKLATLPQAFSMQDYIGNRYLSNYSKNITVHNQYQQHQPSQVMPQQAKISSWGYSTPSAQMPSTNSYYKPTPEINFANDYNNALSQKYGFDTTGYFPVQNSYSDQACQFIPQSMSNADSINVYSGQYGQMNGNVNAYYNNIN